MSSESHDIILEDVLRRGLALVRQGWCQGHFACDRNQEVCHPTSAAAVAWCAEGALRKARADMIQALPTPCDPSVHTVYDAYREGIRHLATTASGMIPRLAAWNDLRERTQDDVVRLYDEALRRVEERAKGGGDAD